MESLYFSLSLDGRGLGHAAQAPALHVRVKMGSSPPFISFHQERGDLPEF